MKYHYASLLAIGCELKDKVVKGYYFNDNRVGEYVLPDYDKAMANDLISRMKLYNKLWNITCEDEADYAWLYLYKRELEEQLQYASLNRGVLNYEIKGRKVELNESWIDFTNLITAECWIDGFNLLEREGEHFIVVDSDGHQSLVDSEGCHCNEKQRCVHHHFACGCIVYRPLIKDLILLIP